MVNYNYFRDRKRKRFVGTSGQDPKKKKIKTESGTWIPASYKSNAYPLTIVNVKVLFFLSV